MSFGVGIGDILLVTKMGFTLWVNISGAKQEREDLTADLLKLKAKLEIVEPMLANSGLPPPVAELAREQLSEALTTLEVLEQLNRKLVKGRLFRRAAWEVRGRETFREYRSKLDRCLATMDMLFLSGSMKVVTDEVRETNAVVKRVENGMKYLGFSPDYEPIRFIDALNGQSLLPWESCSTWEKFRTLMQMQYSASAGKSFVERGEYDIINEESGALLRVQDWRKTIKPGMLLSMAIVLREETEKDRNDYTCPSCKTQYAGPVGSSTGHMLERVKCTYCKRWFQISLEPSLMKFGTVVTEGQADLASNTGKLSNAGNLSKDNELMHIQRFHIRLNKVPSKGFDFNPM